MLRSQTGDLPFIITDTIEKTQRFVHPIGRFIFVENLIVFGKCNTEDNGSDIFETMDPRRVVIGDSEELCSRSAVYAPFLSL